MDRDTQSFIEQNPTSADSLTIGQMAPYSEHHSGGLVVLGDFAGIEGHYVKMHDSWGPGTPDEPGDVVVHEYSLDDPDAFDQVWYFDNGSEAYEFFLKRQEAPGETYHGIVKAECLKCGCVRTDAMSMELWNDYGIACMENEHEIGVTRWTLADGTETIVVLTEDGDITTYRKDGS